MDQPPQQPSINTDGILAWALSVAATLVAIFVRGKFRVKALRDKVEAEARPQIETEYLKSSREITEDWKEEVVALRAQVDKVRTDYEVRLSIWMERAYAAEKQIPELKANILMLESRVSDLERQVGEARSQWPDVR